MNDLLKHYSSLPRHALQAEIQRFTEDPSIYLWEFIGMGWIYAPVLAGQLTALHFGIPQGAVIGYKVTEGHVVGGAIGDLMNASPQPAPYPDPFAQNP